MSDRWTRRHLLYQLLVSGLVPVIVLTLTVLWMSRPKSTGSIDLASGREIFEERCVVCHFIRPDVMGHTGPNLRMIGRDASTRKPGLSGSEYLLESVLDPGAFVTPTSRPGMPPNVAAGLTAQQVKNLVGYLASLGAEPDFEELDQLAVEDVPPDPDEPKNVTREQMELAEQVMREKASCLDCHSPHSRPEYGSLAPPIFGVGLRDREQLRTSILEPDRKIVPHYEAIVVALESGLTLTGRLLHQDEYKLVLMVVDSQGRRTLRTIALEDVEQEDGKLKMLKLSRSPMPSGLGELLSDEELSAVLTLLQLLN